LCWTCLFGLADAYQFSADVAQIAFEMTAFVTFSLLRVFDGTERIQKKGRQRGAAKFREETSVMWEGISVHNQNDTIENWHLSHWQNLMTLARPWLDE